MAFMGNGRRKIEVDIIANDKSTKVYNNVADSIQGMANKVNRGIVQINQGLHRYNSAMRTIHRTTQIALAGSGYLFYRFTKDAINQFAEFERQHDKTMGAIASNYDKTAQAQRKFMEDQKRLKEQSLMMGTVGPTGRGSLYQPTEIASAQTALSKAGVKPTDIPVVLPGIIKFAGGNDLGLEQAADFAVNINKMFEIPARQWVDTLDKLTRAADISVIDVPDVFESMKFAGPIASAQGRSLDEVLSMIAVMGNVGIRGSMAGTGIQAFFTKLLSPVGKGEAAMNTAPTDYSRQVLETFIAEATDSDGNFKGTVEVTSMLDELMQTLNDREQAWFAHKLFGLFQMKSGLVLASRGGPELQKLIDDIRNRSSGTIDRKWDMMLESTWGRQMALHNAYMGIKTDVGYRLSPVTSAIADELFKVLTDKSNYEIDFDRLKEAFNTAGDMIAEQYGIQLGDFVTNIGHTGLNVSRAVGANTPLMEGYGLGIAKLLSGDFPGAIQAMSEAIDRANEKIEELPPELQDLATNVRNAALALGALATVNFAARLLENLTTIYRYTIGKMIGSSPINTTNMKTVATRMNVTATQVYINGPVAGGGSGGVLVNSAGSGNKNVILDKSGKSIKPAPTDVVDSANPKGGPSKLSKVGGVAKRGLWAFVIADMLGIPDWIMDQAGLADDSPVRQRINTGRNFINAGFSAYMLDSFIFRGLGQKLITSIMKSLYTGASSTITTLGAGTAGIMSLPIAGGLYALGLENRRNEESEKLLQDLADAKNDPNKIITWGDNKPLIIDKDAYKNTEIRAMPDNFKSRAYMDFSNIPNLSGMIMDAYKLNSQPNVSVNMKPNINVDVDVKLDRDGNVIEQTSRITNLSSLDDAYRRYQHRMGR